MFPRRGTPLSICTPPGEIGWNKRQTTAALNLFFGNPPNGLLDMPGIFTFFNYGDVNFYLTGNRTYRDRQEHLNPFDPK